MAIPDAKHYDPEGHCCPSCGQVYNSADEISRLISEIERLASCYGEEVLKTQLERREVERLSSEVTKYREWFKDNASMLAAHRIGGYSFEDFPDSEIKITTTVSEEREPLYDKKRIRSHYLTGCGCTACREARDAGKPSDREYRA